MRTQGEMEAAVSDSINRFELEYMGRGPKHIRTYLVGDLLIVRLRGVLTIAEQWLVKAHMDMNGRDLLKQIRTELIEAARPMLETLVHDQTGTNVLSLHYDISTTADEEIVLFTLDNVPLYRESKKK
jgi:uncharacterized protein YbcI